ncbi:MAG: response regulator [Deltaproteobacteria bacterium]|nr:response regulator [Deltaproteobacteria bacterium]
MIIAQTIASGSLGHTIARDDKTEFGELANHFNTMSMTLKSGYDRLEAANKELHREIAERRRMEEQLRRSQKMEAIGTLAGGIAHDFNNILMTMLNYTDIAMKSMPPATSVQRHLEKVLIAGRRARDLVRQILLFSRQTERERKPVQVHFLVRELMTLLRASLPSTIEMRQNINASAGTVLADPTQMHQVLINLCSNAEHAMREKGGVLELAVDAVEVDDAFAALHPGVRPGSHVILSVRDTGHGMTPEVLERIFDPFFTTKEMGQGTGMGLAVVHGIVANHGGTVTVESRPGEGTTFAIYLPRIDQAPEDQSPAEGPLPRGTERILYVDDEEDLVDTVREILGGLGYQVTGKTRSTEALEAFRTTPDRFDLIITDQTMPDMSGEALAREFRRIRPDIPIILCTGFSHLIDSEEAQLLGVDAFCFKPMEERDFALTIRSVLAQRST